MDTHIEMEDVTVIFEIYQTLSTMTPQNHTYYLYEYIGVVSFMFIYCVFLCVFCLGGQWGKKQDKKNASNIFYIKKQKSLRKLKPEFHSQYLKCPYNCTCTLISAFSSFYSPENWPTCFVSELLLTF